MTKEEQFVNELIGYIFAYPDDDYMTMECLCRKLHKYGLIEKKDGEWTTDFIDRKTENSSEKPNNCEAKNYCDDCLYTDTCDSKEFFYACTSKATISKMEQVDEPKTQMKTQNSNLTFKTLEYCDICDHKGCEECIANALDEHCMPSQFNKQIEDECTKEYEELGLKELKELIEADRKTENSSEIPNGSEKPNNCECEPRKEQNFCGKCRYLYRDFKYGLSCYRLIDNEPCKYEERKTEPTISKMEQVETMSCQECKHWKYVSNYGWDCEFESVEDCKYEPKDEPQTDCAWK